MKLRFQCQVCKDDTEVEFEIQKSETGRSFPVLMAVRSVLKTRPCISELAAKVLLNEMNRVQGNWHNGRAKQAAKVIAGKVRQG